MSSIGGRCKLMWTADKRQATVAQATRGLMANVGGRAVRTLGRRACSDFGVYSASARLRLSFLASVQIDPDFGVVCEGQHAVRRV